jgi:hypothetical protein
MPNARGIKAGDAYVRVYSDDSDLVKGLKGIGGKLKALGGGIQNVGAGIASVGAGITGLGAAILAPIGAATKAFISAGDELQKMAIRTGVGAGALSELGYAAEQSGTDLATLETALARSQKAITEANDGSAAMVETFQRLGLNTKELARLSPDQQFQRISAAIAAIPDPTERAARAMQIFGRSGTKLLPLMTSDMAALRQQARDLGITLTQEDADAAASLGDAFDDVGKTIKAAFLQVGAAVAGPLTAGAKAITKVTSAAAVWVRENREIVVTIGSIGVALVAVGSTVGVVGAGVVVLGSIITAVGTIATTTAAAITAIGGAAVLGPIAATVGAVAAVGAGLVYIMHQAGFLTPILAFIGESFQRVFGVAQQTIGGVTSALSSGQWGKAAAIAWQGVKLAALVGAQQVLKGVDYLWNNAGKITFNFFKSLTMTVYNVFASLPKIAWSALRGGAALTEAISGALAGAFSGDNLNLAGNLDASIAGAQQQLNRMTAQRQAQARQQQPQQVGGFASVPQPPGLGMAVGQTLQASAPAAPVQSDGANFGALLETARNQLMVLRFIARGQGLT